MTDPFDPFSARALFQSLGQSLSRPDTETALSSVVQKWPGLAGYDWSVVDSRGKGDGKRGLEFYAPDERDNPQPGRPTMELFDPKLRGGSLESALMGDMLHHLPSVDQGWRALRQRFAQSITPEQAGLDRRVHAEAAASGGEGRSFEDWMEDSRLDAYLRNHLAPDAANEWAGAYTPEQIKMLDAMKTYLTKPRERSLP